MPPNSNLRIIMCRVPAKKFGEVFNVSYKVFL